MLWAMFAVYCRDILYPHLFLVMTLCVKSTSARLDLLTSSSSVSGRDPIAAAARFACSIAKSLVLCIPLLFPRYSKACFVFMWSNISDSENVLESLGDFFLLNLQCQHSLDLFQVDQQLCVAVETPPSQTGSELLWSHVGCLIRIPFLETQMCPWSRELRLSIGTPSPSK